MKISTVIFVSVSLFFGPFLSEAQLLRRLKNAAEEGVARAVEKRVVSEVEKATQRQFEKAFGNLYGGPREGVNYDFGKILESINTNVEIADSYTFVGFAEMEVTGTESNGKTADPVLIKSYLSNNEQLTGMEFIDQSDTKTKERSVMIFDFQQNATIMLVEEGENKTRMAFGLDWQNMMENMGGVASEEESDDYKLEDFTFEKTGNSKTILGYSCEEYLAQNEEMEASYWISTEPIAGLQSFWGKNSPFLTQRMKSENKVTLDRFPDGSLMEMYFSSKTDKSTSQFTMVNIETDRSQTFVMADYKNALDPQ
ncbi:DUF4412 domain-containing protein [Lunatimonas salinarum]|uniref:DUF4412 domain-containing protein n=1 Tax=Lunatimonas salinarum TaxID=1774590 RepID=UPI001ADF65DB|nr:DUF4412 domain-containing protein [Lunatimonas salinarum]